MSDKEKKLIEWFFSLIGIFNHYSFFTKKLWKKVKGFKHKDEAEIKAVFIHYWFNHAFGYYTCPCGSSWFAELDKELYDDYIKEYIPVLEEYSKWCEQQR